VAIEFCLQSTRVETSQEVVHVLVAWQRAEGVLVELVPLEGSTLYEDGNIRVHFGCS
jgi:hypothetical protein